MKIYSKTVVDMASGVIEEAEAFEYSGDVAQCGGGGQTTSQSQQLDPAIREAYFGTDGHGGLTGEAQKVYAAHKDNPFNDLQKNAITGMVDYLQSGKGMDYLGPSNQLAANLMGSGKGGVSYTPSPTYKMPQTDLTMLFAPRPTPAAAAPAGLLSTPTVDDTEDDKKKKRGKEGDYRYMMGSGGGE